MHSTFTPEVGSIMGYAVLGARELDEVAAFDGRVVSHTVTFPDGSKKTIGLIYPGSFTFTTGAPEVMEIIAGACKARLKGESAWRPYAAGTSFPVPAKSGTFGTVADWKPTSVHVVKISVVLRAICVCWLVTKSTAST